MVGISVKVQTSPGYGAHEDPVSFKIVERTFLVREIMDRWHGADHTYYKLIADDGNLYVIKHDLDMDEWELVQMEVISGR
jgi:hypothetical protein